MTSEWRHVPPVSVKTWGTLCGNRQKYRFNNRENQLMQRLQKMQNKAGYLSNCISRLFYFLNCRKIKISSFAFQNFPRCFLIAKKRIYVKETGKWINVQKFSRYLEKSGWLLPFWMSKGLHFTLFQANSAFPVFLFSPISVALKVF